MSLRPFILLLASLVLVFPSSTFAKKRSKAKRSISTAQSAKDADRTPDNEALERIYRIQDKRLIDPYLKSSVYHPSAKVVKAAILAMGRIGDPGAVEELARLVNKKNKDYQKLAAFSLGLIGTDVALKILDQQAQWQKDPELRAALLRGIGQVGKESSLKMLSRVIQGESHPAVLESATQALGLLWSGESEKWEVPDGLLARLISLSRSTASYNVVASFALARYKGDPAKIPVNDLLTAVVGTPSLYARGFLIRTLGKVKNMQVGTFLATLSLSGTDLSVRLEAVKALARQSPTPGVIAALKQLLGEPIPVLIVSTLDTVAAYGTLAASLTPVVEGLVRAGPWVQASAMRALARINEEAARAKLSESGGHLSEGTVLQTLASLGESSDLEKLAAQFPTAANKNLVEALDILNALPEGSFPSEFRDALRKLAEKSDPGVIYEASALAEKNRWKDFAAVLIAAYKSFATTDALEAKVAVLTALGTLGDITHIQFLEIALKEDDKLIVEAAAKALKNIAGKENLVPLNSKVPEDPPSQAEIQAAVGVYVTLQTNRGEIQIRMGSDAPITAAKILRLVRAKFYDGKTFHRVVPNFVVQGGDPRGDGFGGPGFFIRDEVGPSKHSRGTVGLATAGKDTGGCQFFFNLAPNLHLDGRYTLFAEITRGLEVAEKLEVGDQILTARVK